MCLYEGELFHVSMQLNVVPVLVNHSNWHISHTFLFHTIVVRRPFSTICQAVSTIVTSDELTNLYNQCCILTKDLGFLSFLICGRLKVGKDCFPMIDASYRQYHPPIDIVEVP